MTLAQKKIVAENEKLKKILEGYKIESYVWGKIAKQQEIDREQPSGAVELWADTFKNSGVKKIIDIGCGRGRHSVYLAEKGFDITASLREHSR